GGERLAVRDDGMIAVADKRGWISLLKLTGKDVVQSWVLPSPGAALKGMDFSSGGLVALYENGLRRWDPTRLSSPSRLVAPPQAEVPVQGRAEDGARGQVYYAENRKKDYDLGAATGLWWQVIGLQDHLSLPFPQQGGPDIQIPDALWRNSAEKTVLFARADGSVHLLPRWETTQWKEMVDLVGGCIPVDDRVLFYGETRSVAEKQLDLCQNPPASAKRAGGEGK
ncbi:MAG TPA: hypothetical protein PLA94_33310, partial [Myxococcota bacterium]|nr:hypothetical protein [Myxococcota bacterium]